MSCGHRYPISCNIILKRAHVALPAASCKHIWVTESSIKDNAAASKNRIFTRATATHTEQA